MPRLFRRLSACAVVLAFALVMLGAYVRLSDAGLGCPDWPGCYGHVTVPATPSHLEAANSAYPDRPVEAHKAWKEMAHRYVAGTLGLLIVLLAVLAWRNRRTPGQPVSLPVVLVGLVIFQALLGMWTVTWKVMPLVVTAHLIFGFATLALLMLLSLRTLPDRPVTSVAPGRLRFIAGLALAVLVAQVFMGAWTSTNYAAAACWDFPTCQGRWWPETDFRSAFTLWRDIGPSYEHGVLDNTSRVTIQLAHRLGALLTFLTLCAVGGYLAFEREAAVRGLGGALLAAVTLQVALGISIVELHLPIPLAVAHNGGAALLLLLLVALNHSAWRARESP